MKFNTVFIGLVLLAVFALSSAGCAKDDDIDKEISRQMQAVYGTEV